jgi:hypothetical protein
MMKTAEQIIHGIAPPSADMCVVFKFGIAVDPWDRRRYYVQHNDCLTHMFLLWTASGREAAAMLEATLIWFSKHHLLG